MLVDQVGAATLLGVLVLLLFIPVNGWVTRKIRQLQTRLMKVKDKRVNATNEVPPCVPCIHTLVQRCSRIPSVTRAVTERHQVYQAVGVGGPVQGAHWHAA